MATFFYNPRSCKPRGIIILIVWSLQMEKQLDGDSDGSKKKRFSKAQVSSQLGSFFSFPLLVEIYSTDPFMQPCTIVMGVKPATRN